MSCFIFSRANLRLIGLGERVAPLRFNTSVPETYSFIASDHGTPDKLPLYGSHPFFMDVRTQTNSPSLAHGVFLLNSNPLDVVLDSSQLTFKTIGGVIDLYVFTGPTPSSVVEAYHQTIGTPFLVPKWSLGYHQCRWGYADLAALQSVVTNFDRYCPQLRRG